MPWTPPPRPAWVASALAGNDVEIAAAAAPPFAVEAVVERALETAGQGDLVSEALGPADWQEPLAMFLDAVEHEADLNVLGRSMVHGFLHRLLVGRIKLFDHNTANPDVARQAIAEPIIVVGAPRTGTTAIHRMLAADPSHRAPEGWELLYPVPPPEPATFDTDPRIEVAGAELALPQRIATGLEAIHAYSARMPKECLSAMSFSFRSEELISRHRVPSYARWLASADMTPAYDMHKLVLQMLQLHMPPRRWVLKSPVHLQALPTLLATYPDAKLVITHRDPAAILGSVTSLIATLRWAHSDAVDFEEIGRYHLDLYAKSLDELVDLVDHGMIDPSGCAHVNHAEVVASPVAAAASVYDQLGIELGSEARTAMHAAAEAVPRNLHGEHRWDFSDLGLSEGEVSARFARYRERFL